MTLKTSAQATREEQTASWGRWVGFCIRGIEPELREWSQRSLEGIQKEKKKAGVIMGEENIKQSVSQVLAPDVRSARVELDNHRVKDHISDTPFLPLQLLYDYNDDFAQPVNEKRRYPVARLCPSEQKEVGKKYLLNKNPDIITDTWAFVALFVTIIAFGIELLVKSYNPLNSEPTMFFIPLLAIAFILSVLAYKSNNRDKRAMEGLVDLLESTSETVVFEELGITRPGVAHSAMLKRGKPRSLYYDKELIIYDIENSRVIGVIENFDRMTTELVIAPM